MEFILKYIIFISVSIVIFNILHLLIRKTAGIRLSRILSLICALLYIGCSAFLIYAGIGLENALLLLLLSMLTAFGKEGQR